MTHKKLPAFQMYTGDWLKDPKLSKCSPATRGIWMDLICAMHESDRSGELRGTTEQLARIARCSTVELVHAATELQTTDAANVTIRNGDVTLINRRMHREYKERLATRRRVNRHRCNADETIPSSSSSSTSPPGPLGEGEVHEAEARRFAQSWVAANYPTYLRKCQGLVRLIVQLGRDEAVRRVEQALAAGKTADPFAYVTACLVNKQAKDTVAAKAAKPVKNWNEGVLPNGQKPRLTSPPKAVGG